VFLQHSQAQSISNDVILPPNEFRRPGPFYGQPLRKLVQCGMAASTFGAERHGNKVLAVKDIRNRPSAFSVRLRYGDGVVVQQRFVKVE